MSVIDNESRLVIGDELGYSYVRCVVVSSTTTGVLEDLFVGAAGLDVDPLSTTCSHGL